MESLLVDETVRLLDPGAQAEEVSIPRPTTEDELRAVVFDLLGVRIPDVAVCPGHSSPWQAFSEAYFATSPVSVWKGARGLAGKSFLLATLAWIEAVTLRASVTLLGGSGEQSERVHDYMRTFWNRPQAPTAALVGDPSKRRTILAWGNKIDAQTASQKSVRGAHPERLRLDEIDEMDLKILESALGQPMTRGDVPSQTVMSSTHQHADGTMTAMLRYAAERNFPVREWCWKESLEPHGWLSMAEVDRKRSTMTAESWRVEVELGEPSPEGRAIVTEKVEAMFAGEEIRVPDWDYRELEAPVDSAVYATGADWAKEHDLTCIWTWRCDVNPMRLVAYERGNKRPWPWMFGRLDARLRRYPGEAYHDRLGCGAPGSDLFEEPVEDYTMAGRARDDLFLQYIAAIERGEYVAPKILTAYQSHRYVTNVDLFGKGHPPDEFVAAALAHQAALLVRNPLGLVSAGKQEAKGRGAGQQMPAPRTPSGSGDGYLAGLLRKKE